jgi:hypothetical protein
MPVRTLAITSAGLLTIASANVAFAAEPTRDELAEEIRQLKARIEQLEAKQPTTGPSAADVDRIVHDVVADANRRSQLLMQEGDITAGFDLERSKFYIRSADGNFLFMPGFLFQARNTTNVTTGDDDDVQNGFEIRRMRFYFVGNAFTPELTYRFQWESASNGGGVFLQDAFVRYQFADQWAVQVGQFYDEYSHEQSMLDPFMLAADRSLINALIGGGQTERVQGVMLMYDDREHWVAQAIFHDGANTDNTDWEEAGGGSAFLGVTDPNFGASGRVEYFFSGTRKAYETFTALGTTENLLVAGAGADFTQGGDSSALFHLVDLQYENTSGCSGYVALHGLWRDIGADSPVAAGEYYDWGVLVQAAHLFTRTCELFVRYDYTQIDDDSLAAGAEDQFHEFTIGGNYYYHNHNAKITIDFTWLPNGAPVNLPTLGFLAGDDDEFVIRAQLQLFI